MTKVVEYHLKYAIVVLNRTAKTFRNLITQTNIIFLMKKIYLDENHQNANKNIKKYLKDYQENK